MSQRIVLAITFGMAVCSLVGCTSDSPVGGVPKGSDPTIPTSGPIKLSGKVVLRESGAAPSPIEGAVVEVRGDFNADGTVAGDEVVSAKTNAHGEYSLSQEFKGRADLVVAIRAKDALPSFKRLELAPPSTQVVDAELFGGLPLEKEGEALTLPGGALRIKGLPQDYAGVARRFNPVLEMKAFPGDFADDQGNVLRSGVFATVALTDGKGAAVHQLPAPATLEMEMPRESWRAVRDMKAGTDRIEVPMYTFDETRGVWTREGDGYLVDGEGTLIAENSSHDITQRKFPGKVIVVSQVTHFSTTNCDFPAWVPNIVRAVVTCGKCTGEQASNPEKKENPKRTFGNQKWKPKPTNEESFTRPLRAQAPPDLVAGEPVTGASLTVEMYFPDGTPAGHVSAVVEPDGSFELPVGRSEREGEDLDESGITGESFFSRVTLSWRGERYDIIEGNLPALTSYIADLGVIDLWDSASSVGICDIAGTVKSLGGKPVEGVSVGFTWSFGNSMDDTTVQSLCGEPSKCSDTAVSGSDGTFKLAWPIYDAFGLQGERIANNGPVEEWYRGVLYLGGCPTAPVSLVLDQGRIGTTAELFVEGTEIRWAPNVAVQWLGVWGADMGTKWMLHAASPGGFKGPVQYGVVPAGATEEAPAQGLVGSGDHVQITGTFTTEEGYESVVGGFLEIP